VYRALLRTMTSKDKASYASSPPCMSCVSSDHFIDYVSFWFHRADFYYILCFSRVENISYVSFSCLDVYGVASISRLLKITGLFCKRAL